MCPTFSLSRNQVVVFQFRSNRYLSRTALRNSGNIFLVPVLILLFAATSLSATFVVTKTADTNDGVCDSDCSLREAITASNQSGGSDTINFDPNVFSKSQTIVLTGGQLETSEFADLTINGPGMNLLTISGNDLNRVILISPKGTVTISNLRIANGRVSANEEGAALVSQVATTTLINVAFENNVTESDGGAIYNHTGNLTISGCSFLNNSAGVDGGVIHSGTSTSTIPLVTVTNSTFVGNTATSGGGGAISGRYTLNVSDSSFLSNTAAFGGAVIGGNSFTNVSFTGNQALVLYGGALVGARSIVNSTFDNNSAVVSGGAIFFNCSTSGGGQTLTVQGSVLSNNVAGQDGGGIYDSRCKLLIENTTLSNNTANRNGGGFYHDNTFSDTVMNGLAITNNLSIRDGGGVFNAGGVLTINQSILAHNSATSIGGEGGGGIYNEIATAYFNNTVLTGNSTDAQGGGIFNRGTINLSNATVNGNNAGTAGGGVYNFSSRTVNALSTLIGNNSVTTGVAADFSGTLQSLGFNLIENVTGTVITGTTTGNITGQDPGLLPVGSYGGHTESVALMPTSPAIDAGDPVNFPTVDQRGVVRAQDGDLDGTSLPDIGAYERQVTTLTVTKAADTNDGTCDSDCSLREAITSANKAATPDNAIIFDPVVFNSPTTIVLSGGQLTINGGNTLLIRGSSEHRLSISGNDQTRIFFLDSAPGVAITDLTITAGREQFSDGGGIYHSLGNLVLTNVMLGSNFATNGGGVKNVGGRLTIRDSLLTGNTAATSGGAISNSGFGQSQGFLKIIDSVIQDNTSLHAGGGIDDSFGSVSLAGVTISGNTVTGSSNSGGGIRSVGGTLSIDGSTFFSNTATDSGGAILISGSDADLKVINTVFAGNQATNGGGLRSNSAAVALTDSTLRNNSAGFRGGGILANGGTLSVVGSTINDNSALDDGGGIANFAVATISNSTITANSAGDRAGGIYNGTEVTLTNVTVSGNTANFFGGAFNNGSIFRVRNSIFGDNTATAAPDFQGSMESQGYNLIENPSGATIAGNTTGNILGQDPGLGELADHAGPTYSQFLLPGSPAIDSGDPGNVLASDQRGFSRPRDGDGDGVARSDIGAFEVRPVLVTNTSDAGTGSLRQAIADASTNGDAVVFDASQFTLPRTITLTGGELFVPSGAHFTINGRGAEKLTISGNHQSRVVFVDTGASLRINGVTISGGNGVGSVHSGHGGGISNWGSLWLTHTVIEGNSANGNGGGVSSNLNSTIAISNTTIRDNSAATIAGGGIIVQDSSAFVTKSTINNNSAGGVGGGMAIIFGTVIATNSTISNNVAGNGGGGISNFTASSILTINNSTLSGNISNMNSGGGINNTTGGTVNARNTIIANNAGISPDFSGPLNSQGYNLIKDTTGTVIQGINTGNILGQDPRLLPLGNYGGTTQTQALRPGSPAIDNGSAVSGIAADQRSMARPFDFASVPNAPGGDGADIGAFERQANDVTTSVQFDFDGDGRTDVSIFRPSAGQWWYLKSSDGGNAAAQFGTGTDVTVPADYTGDGRADFAIFRPATGEWLVLRSEDFSFYAFPFGTSTDIPAPADYDGDGKMDPAVFRPSTGTWFILRSSDSQISITGFGGPGDQPITGDFDGDGRADVGVFRSNGQSGAEWWIQGSRDGLFATQFGLPTDKAVAADYTGDGKTDIALFRPSTGEWYVLRSEDLSFYAFPFGASEDFPVPGDYDGDGKIDAAVFRPSSATWFVFGSTSGTVITTFGQPGDTPLPHSYVR